MFKKVPARELESRLSRFRKRMDAENETWEMAVVVNKINLYYFTGSMQEGMLVIRRDGNTVYWVRRSHERAVHESLFADIRPMDSFRDAAAGSGDIPSIIHVETEFLPLAYLQRFRKHFHYKDVMPLDGQVAAVRSVKSQYELDIMERCGEKHRIVLEERIPPLLKEGMSEVDLAGELYRVMLQEGHHGVARFGMFDTEIIIGHIAFGESSLYPTSFNGPGGSFGMGPAVPLIGNRNKKLSIGDNIFIDIGFGMEGYHTDKTMCYTFGAHATETVQSVHNACVDIQDRIAAALRPGAIPSKIYEEEISRLSPAFLENFMGFGERQVKFLGHGIGLVIDEIPVIAKGFDSPLEAGMVMAIEPKKGIAGVGMVGTENTYIVTPDGGKCITGNSHGLLPVK